MQTQPKNQSSQAADASAQSIRIVAVKGGDMAGTWEFQKDSIGIGRGANADVKLDGKNISRIHTVIERRAEGIFVKDGGSLNGTWVNGLRITEKQISARDIVHVGGFRLKAFLAATPMPSQRAPEGSRVQLHAVPSEESARANDATEPQIQVSRGKMPETDPLPTGEENLSSADAETPDPLPLESEMPAFDVRATKPAPKVEVESEERTPADEEPVTAKVPAPAPIAAAPAPVPAARIPAPPAPRYLRQPETTTPSAPIPTEARPAAAAVATKSIVVKPAAKSAVAAKAPKAPSAGKPLTTWVAYAFGAMIASTIGLVMFAHLVVIVLAFL